MKAILHFHIDRNDTLTQYMVGNDTAQPLESFLATKEIDWPNSIAPLAGVRLDEAGVEFYITDAPLKLDGENSLYLIKLFPRSMNHPRNPCNWWYYDEMKTIHQKLSEAGDWNIVAVPSQWGKEKV